ncbi:MAG TPA: glycogen-binding domain-containing protein [bacterium]|nr:glycogen-binding domain-containing protein [bacterium]
MKFKNYLCFSFLIISIFLLNGCGGFLNLIKPRLPGPHKVEGGYMFQLDKPSANTVQVLGDWNDWGNKGSAGDSFKDPEIGKLAKNSEGIWQRIEKLSPGRHIYKFVIDGNNWIEDPNNRDFSEDGNSLIIAE